MWNGGDRGNKKISGLYPSAKKLGLNVDDKDHVAKDYRILLNVGDADGAGDPRRNDSGWVGQFIHFAVAEVGEKRAGSESVLTKLSELMFIDVVRRYIETLPGQTPAGLRACAIRWSARHWR